MWTGSTVRQGPATVSTYVEPHRRATAIALILLSSFMLGLGPVAIGVISDLLAPRFDVQTLRYGLIAMLFMPIWASVQFWLAARSSRQWSLG